MNKKPIIFLLCMAMNVVAYATLIPDMKFSRIDTRHGLSNSQVNCIMKDRRGFVWMGTPYGLNRYDGYRIKTFYSNSRDSTSMRENYVDAIFEAADGRLWLRQGMNYCIYDPVTERFNRNVSATLAAYGIKGSVDFLHIDSRSRFWVKTYGQGLYIYDPRKKTLRYIKNGYGQDLLDPTVAISTMDEKGNTMVISTTKGELIGIDGDEGRILWTDKWIRQHCGVEVQQFRISIDPEGNYWCSVLNQSYVYMQAEHRWYNSITDCLRAHGILELPDELEVWDVKFDKNGWGWLGTDHEGVIVFDLKGHQVRQFKNNKFNENTLSDNTIRSLYEAENGMMWIGTYRNGACQYRRSLENFSSLELGDINTVTEDRQGNYWLGTDDRGIIVYNPRTDSVIHRINVTNAPLSSNVIVGSCRASDGTIWFGSYNGGLIHCLPGSGGSAPTVINYRATGDTLGLVNNNVWGVTEDRWHRIWITTLGGGIQRLDPRTGIFRTWNQENSHLSSDYTTSIGWIKKGWAVVGTSNYYAFINPLTGKVANRVIPKSDNVETSINTTTYVMEDSRGLIWHGSASGALVYDQKTGFVQLLDMTDGFYGSSVTSFVEDRLHAVWVITDHGVSRVQPQRQDDGTWQFIIRSYNVREGLQHGIYNQRSAYISDKGLLLIGGQDGLDIINPANLGHTKNQQCPLLSGLQISGQDIIPGMKYDGHVILEKALSVSSDLFLNYDENDFTIQLGSDAAVANNDKRFVYRLVGARDVWVKTAPNNPNISFVSLPPGDYSLRVRVLNDDGTLGEIETTLDIHVAAPWWSSGLAKVFYVLLAIGIFWYWRRNFIRRHNERVAIHRLHHEVEKERWKSQVREELRQHGTDAPSLAPDPENESIDDLSDLKFEPSQGEIVGYVQRVVSNFEVPKGHRCVNFHASINRLTMRFDPALLARMLNQLMANAVKFSPSNSRVKVSIGLTGSIVEISVADRGLGLPPDVRDDVFEPSGDVGLGFLMIKRVVDLHSGTIHFEPNPGGGTVFVVSLPTDSQDDTPVEEIQELEK